MRTLSTDLKQLLVRRYTNRADVKSYSDWAEAELLAGEDTPSLRIVAGLRKLCYWPELELYFEKALDELGITLPDKQEFLWQYVYDIAEMTLAGKITVEISCQEIQSIYHTLDYPHELSTWAYLYDEFEYIVPAGMTLQDAVKEEAKMFLSESAEKNRTTRTNFDKPKNLFHALRDLLRLRFRQTRD